MLETVENSAEALLEIDDISTDLEIVKSDAADEILTLAPEAVRSMVEAVLLTSAKPMQLNAIFDRLSIKIQLELSDVENALQEIEIYYQDRGLRLVRVKSGYRFQVPPEIGRIMTACEDTRPPKYSRAFLETLALIAYRQPITRGEIEEIRGVSVNSQIIKSMMERDWIRVVGHRDVPGRPALLATTSQFLDYFGLRALEDLPPLLTEMVDAIDTHQDLVHAVPSVSNNELLVLQEENEEDLMKMVEPDLEELEHKQLFLEEQQKEQEVVSSIFDQATTMVDALEEEYGHEIEQILDAEPEQERHNAITLPDDKQTSNHLSLSALAERHLSRFKDSDDEQ
ncbi:MAG: SMC-Scp complex subunit ScpB [Pseudomonadota bacterium]